MLISGCDYINLPTKEDFISTKECRDWALSKAQQEYELFEGANNNNWFDKDNIDKYYTKGSQKGENINYFYYRGPRNKPYTLSETAIDDQGNILGIKKAEYFPVLEPMPQTQETYQTIVGLKRLKQKFKLYDIEIVSCRIER